MDPATVLDALIPVVAELPGAVLRLDVPDEVYQPGNHWYSPTLGAKLRRYGEHAEQHGAPSASGSRRPIAPCMSLRSHEHTAGWQPSNRVTAANAICPSGADDGLAVPPSQWFR